MLWNLRLIEVGVCLELQTSSITSYFDAV